MRHLRPWISWGLYALGILAFVAGAIPPIVDPARSHYDTGLHLMIVGIGLWIFEWRFRAQKLIN